MIKILLTLFYLLICIVIIKRSAFFRNTDIKTNFLLLFFLLKFGAAVALTLLYTYYYPKETADIFRFFNDAKPIYASLFENPVYYLKLITGFDNENPELQPYLNQINNWTKLFDDRMYNDTQTIIRFNALVMLFSFGEFYVHNVFASFLSFVGITALYKFVMFHIKEKSTVYVIAIFLLPSVIFWSSGVLKESLVMFALGLFLYATQRLFCEFSVKNLAISLFGFWILSITKYYVIIALIPGLVAYLWHLKNENISPITKYSIVHGATAILFILNETVFHIIPILDLIALKQNDFINFTCELGNVGSLIELTRLDNTFSSFLEVLPEAFVNSFFRPWPWEIHSFIAIIPTLENIAIIAIIVIAIMRPNKKEKDFNFIFFASSFILILFLLSGYTTPVLGALVRYKVPALPFLYIVIVYLIDKNFIIQILGKYKTDDIFYSINDN